MTPDQLGALIVAAVVGALIHKSMGFLLAKRNGGGTRSGRLIAARELADLTASMDDILGRVSALETSVQALARRERRGHGD